MSRDQVVHEVVYPHPPDRVWAALTTSAFLAHWLAPNDFAPRVGHRFTFHVPAQPGWDGRVACEVLVCDAPHCLALSWLGHPHAPATTVTFTLWAAPAGTRLRVEHQHATISSGTIAALRQLLPNLRVVPGTENLPMGRFFRFQVDEVALTDALFAFVTDPTAARNERPVIHELHEVAPDMVPVLEHMILDGVEERQHVAAYVQAVVNYSGW